MLWIFVALRPSRVIASLPGVGFHAVSVIPRIPIFSEGVSRRCPSGIEWRPTVRPGFGGHRTVSVPLKAVLGLAQMFVVGVKLSAPFIEKHRLRARPFEKVGQNVDDPGLVAVVECQIGIVPVPFNAEAAVNVPLSLLTPTLDGFGVLVNYSDTKSSLDLSTAGFNVKDIGTSTIPLPGLSRRVTNVRAYYEKYGFQISVAQRTRPASISANRWRQIASRTMALAAGSRRTGCTSCGD